MRLGSIKGYMTNPILEEFLLYFGLVPVPLRDCMPPLMGSRVISVANKLRFFEYLHSDWLDAGSLARTANTDPELTEVVVKLLHSMGYLSKRQDSYRNSVMADKFLKQGGKASFSKFICMWEDQAIYWGRLEECLRAGQLRDSYLDKVTQDPVVRKNYVLGMRETAEQICSEVAKKLNLRQAKTLLDLGGGHGVHSAALCQRYPNLKATVFDYPETLEYAKAIVSEQRVSNRISFRPGDFLEAEDLGGPYDVILLFHIIHFSGPEQNRILFERVSQSLAPGGQAVVLEFLLDDAKSKTMFNLMFSLHLRLMSPTGRLYSYAEVKSLMDQTMMSSITQMKLITGESLVVGRKSA